MKKEFCLHYAVRIFKWILSFLSSTMVAEMEQNVIKIYLYSIKYFYSMKYISIEKTYFYLKKYNFIRWKKKCSLKNPGLFNFQIEIFVCDRSHGKFSDDQFVLLLPLFIVSERKFNSAKQIISSWVKGFHLKTVFSMCTTFLQTSFGRTFL